MKGKRSMTKEKDILVGAHMSIAGGFYKAIEQGEKIGCTALQIFTKNNRTYFGKKITQQDRGKFKETLKNSSVKSVATHASYLINIGSHNADVEKKSVSALVHELERCDQLCIPYLIIHPGSHTGAGEEKCITQIAYNLDKALKKIKNRTMILLETAAGQGTNVGYTFEQLRAIYDQCKQRKRIGFCLDTCHIFCAGYNINTPDGYKKVWQQFEKVLGRSKLKIIHLNDSKMTCGSRRDRHEHIGTGEISIATFKRIMNDPKLKNIPKILETPDEEKYEKEIALLKKMVSKKETI